MEGTQSLQFWSIFGPNLSPENEKYWEKNKIFPETASSGISDYTDPSS